MFGFGKKKLYEVGYKIITTEYTLIVARNPAQAMRKLRRQWCSADIVSIKEIGEC